MPRKAAVDWDMWRDPPAKSLEGRETSSMSLEEASMMADNDKNPRFKIKLTLSLVHQLDLRSKCS